MEIENDKKIEQEMEFKENENIVGQEKPEVEEK